MWPPRAGGLLRPYDPTHPGRPHRAAPTCPLPISEQKRVGPRWGSDEGRVLLPRLVVDRRVGGVLLHRLDAVLHGGGGGVALALADHLAVGGLEDEIGLAVLVGLALVALVDGGVAFHRLDAVQGSPLLGVELAGQDHLAVARLEVEPELTVARRLQLELASHPRSFRPGGLREPGCTGGGFCSRNAEQMVLQVDPVRGDPHSPNPLSPSLPPDLTGERGLKKPILDRISPSSPRRTGGRPGEEGRGDEGQRTGDASSDNGEPAMLPVVKAHPMLRLRYIANGEDRVVPHAGGRTRLGRGGDNEGILSDVSVSRYHAEILREGGGWIGHDLKSTNGVEVNRVPVEKAPLRAGDLLTVGSFELRLEEEEARPPRPEPAASEGIDGTVAGFGNATIIRSLADFAAAYGLKEGVGPVPTTVQETEEQAYVHRMFGFLTRLARMLIVAESVDDVLSRVLDLAFEAFPVDRGFILLSDDAGELVCELARIKNTSQLHPTGEVPVSRTMLQAVIDERVALVTFDAQADQRLSGGESIRLHQIRSAMCAPLWSGERIMGVIQVDSPFHVGAFGERDIDVLATLANYAAVAVERIRYARKAETERQARSRLERYHSPSVIEEVLRGGDEGMRRLQSAQATVLFADLVGFTTFAENAPPERVAESIDAFLDLSVEAIFRAGGTLDKFIGDCVMAFFGAPVAQSDHALRGVRAAVEIQTGLAAWNARRAAEGLPGFKARVALNSGPVVVGDIGSARRVDYTVLGNTVNVAPRLEGVAPPDEIVIGPETHRLLDGAFSTEPLGELQLKGLQQRIQAYRVVRG